jgi:poly-gamma-glutamate synthase PgsB/CapB
MTMRVKTPPPSDRQQTLSVRQLLEVGLAPTWIRVEAGLLQDLASGFAAHSGQVSAAAPRPAYADGVRPVSEAEALAGYLLGAVEAERNELTRLRLHHLEFVKRFGAAASERERRQQILAHAADLGANRATLRGDAAAFGRWFDADAVDDRYRKRFSGRERRLAFILQRLGAVAGWLLGAEGAAQGYRPLWRRLDLERTLQPLLTYEGDSRVRIAAFACLASALRALPRPEQEGSVAGNTLQYIYRSAMEPGQQVWIQCEALRLLQSLSLDSLQTALEKRLAEPRGGDDLFLRRRALGILGETLAERPALVGLLPLAAADPSPFVRQGVAAALLLAPADKVMPLLSALALQDPEPAVRGAALLEISTLLTRSELLAELLELLQQALEREGDAFVLRLACQVASNGQEALQAAGHAAAAGGWRQRLLPVLGALHRGAAELAVRRWAAESREALWCAGDPAASALKERLVGRLRKHPPGRRRRLPAALLRGVEEATLGRVLSELSRRDYGFDLETGPLGRHLSRGPLFRFRLWRLLHELRHPSPDKRQAFSHTVGRVFRGQLRAPSAILAELAETKVPGEPLFLAEEGGWRPYLPLVDEVISSLDRLGAQPVRFYTAEGVTELLPPPSLAARLAARTILSSRFAHYARLRNWREQDATAPSAYLEALTRLGFRLRLTGHPQHPGGPPCVDPAVARFFPATLPLLGGEFWPRLQNYFFSLYENTLYHLVLFTGGALALFLGRSLYLQQALRRARKRLPLVIGGWGTRGKSGSERLKAALVNALGYAVVAKTTGCEAMFLHATPYGPTREMFLFRSYDKASIWEHHQLVRLAAQLGTEVFLYECMALTPAFVRILQRWMRDDVTTITNSYPDHEDLMGPAGINVPQVMTEFIPASGVLCTSEEQMLPVLAQGAAAQGTRLHSVGWREVGLLTPDILERFPYQEHPHNIALLLSLAAELGVPADFALKEMADRVVPDIGVLKSFPAAAVDGRRLEFVNGMSANERYATLANWERMGFDQHRPEVEPGVWISTVVNNRADRVPRSQVFARILVEDLQADRHFLIGSNLQGLTGYLHQAWADYARRLTLWPGGASSQTPAQILSAAAGRLRIPRTEEVLAKRLAAQLQGLGLTVDAAAASELLQDAGALQQLLEEGGASRHAAAIDASMAAGRRQLQEYQALLGRLPQSPTPAEVEVCNREFRTLLGRWFEAKLVLIEDPHASGEAILGRICADTPPGLHNRIMGLQNIKGPGLGFVYAWQAWERCHQACRQLRSRDAAEAEAGLRQLAAFRDYGLLSEELVRETVAVVKKSPLAQREIFQAELTLILANLETALLQLRGRRGPAGSKGWLVALLSAVESFLDAGDAVKRRKIANRIYRDLVHERISHARAAQELQELNQRQKGGWLLTQIHALQQRQPPPVPGAARQVPGRP